MWTQRYGRIGWLGGALWCAAVAACGKAGDQLENTARRSGADAGQIPSCRGDALRPSALPPAEGVWSSQVANGRGRVAVMLGPTELRGGAAVVTRSVEAIETGAEGERRSRVDTAVVHLDLLPPFGSPVPDQDSGSRQSAAVYAITPLVLIAAYEPCADVGAPAIRYLRRDARGHVAIDAMLHRDTEAREQ